MFATIAGPYPLLDAPRDEALRLTMTDQLEAGLGMVGDGRVRALTTDDDVDAAVRAWGAANTLVAQLAQESDVPAPPVKACLVGPMSTPGPSAGVADRVRRAIERLFAAGAPVVQLDETTLRQVTGVTDGDRRRAVRTWRGCLAGVTGHVSLALPPGVPSAFGADALSDTPVASHLVDLIHGPDDWRVVARLPGERGVILGVGDLRPGRTADTLEVLLWAARYAASMEGRGLARVGLAPSAGLERLPREVARARLARLAEAARVATLSPEELAKVVDPRSIDARSAALGRWEPRPNRPTRSPERESHTGG